MACRSCGTEERWGLSGYGRGNRVHVNRKLDMGAMRRSCIFHSRGRSGAAALIENGDRAGPARRPGAHLDRKAAHLEAFRRQLLQIVQLLEMAIADLAAGLVAFPD